MSPWTGSVVDITKDCVWGDVAKYLWLLLDVNFYSAQSLITKPLMHSIITLVPCKDKNVFNHCLKAATLSLLWVCQVPIVHKWVPHVQSCIAECTPYEGCQFGQVTHTVGNSTVYYSSLPWVVTHVAARVCCELIVSDVTVEYLEVVGVDRNSCRWCFRRVSL